jgi:hypothetical protein
VSTACEVYERTFETIASALSAIGQLSLIRVGTGPSCNLSVDALLATFGGCVCLFAFFAQQSCGPEDAHESSATTVSAEFVVVSEEA